MNKAYVYLDKEEELGEIIEKIKNLKEKEIILVVPLETKSLLHQTNLEIFKNEVKKLNKKVYLSTEDESLIKLAHLKGLDIFLEEAETEKIISDIKPPKKKTEKEKTPSPQPRKISFNFIKILKTFLWILLAGSFTVFLYFIFQTKAEINIETQKTDVPISEVVTVKENVLNNDHENKTLKGEYLRLELVKTETLRPTGKEITEKSPLKVVFFNYLEREVPLVIGTRLAYENNIFRISERITLPPKEGEEPGQKITTAFPDANIENLTLLKNTDLKIPALEGVKMDSGYWTDYIKVKVYEDYNPYAETKMPTVLPEDITTVKLNLEKSLISAFQTELSLKYPNYFYPFDPSLVKIETLTVNSKVGDKIENISATGKGILEIMVLPQREIENFVKDILNKEILAKGDNLLVEKLNLEKPELIDLDLKKKTMVLGVKGSAILSPNINEEMVKKEIAGQSLEFAKDYFSKIKGLNSVKIKIFPQWKEYLPKDLKRIKVSIK